MVFDMVFYFESSLSVLKLFNMFVIFGNFFFVVFVFRYFFLIMLKFFLW